MSSPFHRDFPPAPTVANDNPSPEDLRKAWAALREWQGPWEPAVYGDMSGLINGLILTMKVKRWTEIDGTEMAAAMCNGIELERKPVVEPSLH